MRVILGCVRVILGLYGVRLELYEDIVEKKMGTTIM